MKQILVLLCLFAVSFGLIIPPHEFGVHNEFVSFMSMYNKEYTREEYSQRYENFKASLERIQQLNNEGGATFGINEFADMSPEEFKDKILMKIPIEVFNNTDFDPYFQPEATDFDWRSKGGVTAVKNQGQCGSCWAFSATEAIESAWILGGHATASSINLAPQQIVDCDRTSAGCNGGTTESAYNYVHQAGGEEGTDHYPYTAKDGTCKFSAQYVQAKISSYKKATSRGDENTLQSNLQSWGPISICLDASKWQHYSSGVMTSTQCCTGSCQLDHCVQLVGFSGTSSPAYWIVRNSWGTSWGISGYIHLEMGKNTCGLTNDATWPTL